MPVLKLSATNLARRPPPAVKLVRRRAERTAARTMATNERRVGERLRIRSTVFRGVWDFNHPFYNDKMLSSRHSFYKICLQGNNFGHINQCAVCVNHGGGVAKEEL